MAKIALDLDNKNDEEIRTFATNHKNAMTGNVHFPSPQPTILAFNDDLAAYAAILDEIAVDEGNLTSKRQQKEALKKQVMGNLTARGTHVETASGGDPVKMATSNLPLQGAPVPTTSMPQPQHAVATTGDNEGEADVACDAVARAKAYLWQYRTHIEGQPPGPWQNHTPAGKSATTITGLTPGVQYAFRVQVLGPKELLSPWSDECIARAM